MLVARLIVALTGRLVVSGDLPDAVRGGPVLLAANHIGNLDPVVLAAACARIRVAPRFLATGGLFETRVVGRALRAGGNVRVDRGGTSAVAALDRVVTALRDDQRPVVIYPEGRISHEPGLWPEHGKTGVSRMALAAGATVIPVSQWGAHEGMCYGMVRIRGAHDLWILFSSWLRALPRHPTFSVHFGRPVPLGDLAADRLGDAARARDRIMRAITSGLAELRRAEPDLPHHHDPTRPVSAKRSPWRD